MKTRIEIKRQQIPDNPPRKGRVLTELEPTKLSEKQAIKEVIYRYAEGIHLLDTDILEEAFAEDGLVHDGLFYVPAKDLIERWRSGEPFPFEIIQHDVGKIRIRLHGKGAAR